jgi:LPS-assembly lipoprotein
MSSPDPIKRRIRTAIAVALVALPLAGCFRPLYGEVAGVNLRATLAEIEVDPIPDRLGHYLRNELAFDLDGSGEARPKRYRLTIQVVERVASPIVDTATGRAQAGTLTGEATYVLKAMASEQVMAEGKAVAFASYDRNPQRFAATRAARDAEIRLATQLAEQIRIRLATALAEAR